MAAADLALRQAETNPFRLAGLAPRPARCLLSFGRLADPAREIEPAPGASSRAPLKLDVAEEWSGGTLRALRALGRVRVLDLKGRGDLALAERVHAGVPEAIVEDPALTAGGPAPSPSLARRIAFDQPVRTAADVGGLPVRPAAVNVKPARMGGLFEALRAVAECRARDIRTYVGGMFEVGPGREQLQVLAALLAPDEWNDVAPLAGGPRAGEDGLVTIPGDFHGLGYDPVGAGDAAAAPGIGGGRASTPAAAAPGR
jgi:hypothetical protein